MIHPRHSFLRGESANIALMKFCTCTRLTNRWVEIREEAWNFRILGQHVQVQKVVQQFELGTHDTVLSKSQIEIHRTA